MDLCCISQLVHTPPSFFIAILGFSFTPAKLSPCLMICMSVFAFHKDYLQPIDATFMSILVGDNELNTSEWVIWWQSWTPPSIRQKWWWLSGSARFNTWWFYSSFDILRCCSRLFLTKGSFAPSLQNGYRNGAGVWLTIPPRWSSQRELHYGTRA